MEMEKKMNVLVTGAAGFIGAALCGLLVRKGFKVTGIDSVNAYYDPRLKHARLGNLGFTLPADGEVVRTTPATGYDRSEIEYREIPYGRRLTSALNPELAFIRLDLTDRDGLESLCERERFDVMVNLAAQAGVRYSIENPYAYVESNVVGFLNLLECARRWPVKHFLYASSSSVYGSNAKVPFSEKDRVDDPVSLYAATKKCDELMAHVYAGLYHIPLTGLRFFTVYGPWGRPDMAPMLFSDAIMNGDEIKVFNSGNLSRDFTYIDDIVEGIEKLIDKAPEDPSLARVFNIGCGRPMNLLEFITTLETALGREARKKMYPMQPGDVMTTFADTTELRNVTGYAPKTTLKEGVERFAEWYLSENKRTR